jgi:hypothetical protein
VLLLNMAGSSFCTFECVNLWEHLTQDGARYRGASLLIPISLERTRDARRIDFDR